MESWLTEGSWMTDAWVARVWSCGNIHLVTFLARSLPLRAAYGGVPLVKFRENGLSVHGRGKKTNGFLKLEQLREYILIPI
jgi:hypothetical protein